MSAHFPAGTLARLHLESLLAPALWFGVVSDEFVPFPVRPVGRAQREHVAGAQEPAEGELGIWGRRCQAQQPVREGDRIEIYRPLRVDPKVARRERFRKQGARGAGLFAQRRPGAKPGY